MAGRGRKTALGTTRNYEDRRRGDNEWASKYDAHPVFAPYLILGIGSIVVLTRMFRNNPVEREIEDRNTEKGGDVL